MPQPDVASSLTGRTEKLLRVINVLYKVLGVCPVQREAREQTSTQSGVESRLVDAIETVEDAIDRIGDIEIALREISGRIGTGAQASR